MQKRNYRRFPAVLLAVALLFSLLPVSAFATSSFITVYVTVENETYPAPVGDETDGAAWDGKLLDAVAVDVPEGSSMLFAIETALTEAEISYAESYGYISEIGGLTAGSAGGWDGWTGTINGIAPMVGFGSVYLQGGDEISVQYVTDWSTLTYGTADDASSGFSFSSGVFSYLEGEYSTALTLTLPADALSVQVTAVPNPDGKSLRIYHNGALTGGLDSDIGVADGEVLQVVLGDYEKVYNVAVRLVDTDTAAGLMENIASDYAQDVGDCWYILGVQAYGNESYQYSESLRQSFVNTAVETLMGATSSSGASTLALNILALRALGYDPSQLSDIYGNTASGYEILADSSFSSVEGYAYGLMAWLGADGTDYNDEIDDAISYLETQQMSGGYWDGGWGYYADTTSAALLALCMAQDKDKTVSAGVIPTAAAYLESQILVNGSLPGDNDGSEGNANTTAMAALALKAAGLEPSAVTSDGGTNTLFQGLLLFAVGDDSGFVFSNSYGNTYNDYATKQAFLGLIAATAPVGRCNCLDFSGVEASDPAAAVVNGCPVTFSGTPADASVTVKLDSAVQTAQSAGKYDLSAGTYSYTVSKSGYENGTGSFTITEEEAENHTARQISFTLSEEQVESSDEYLYITVKGPSRTILSRRSMVWESGMTPLSALLNTGLSVEYGGGYVSSIAGVAEFDYGENSGWCYEVNGDTGILESAATFELGADDELIWYYTYDYTEDSSWEEGNTSSSAAAGPQTPALGYDDVNEEDWFYEAVSWVTGQGLFKGISETEFLPGGEMTRGMLATVLWRFAGENEEAGAAVFSDVPDGAWYAGAVSWSNASGLMGGYGDGRFGAGDVLTNEQLAAVLWRYAGSPAADGTAAPEGTSSWAAAAMSWAVEKGLFDREDGTEPLPGGFATRAEAADVLMRFAALTAEAG